MNTTAHRRNLKTQLDIIVALVAFFAALVITLSGQVWAAGAEARPRHPQ